MSSDMLPIFGQGILETLYMVLFSTLFAYVIGLPLGVLLVVTAKDGIRPNAAAHKVIDVIVNITRSVPFLILLVAIIPFTRAIVGTSIGTNATIVPLTISAAPFVARLVESPLADVDGGVVEAAQSMGCTTWQTIWKVLLPEAKPGLLRNAAIATTTILGYSAMAGFVGGGGLGAIATNYGYYRYDSITMLSTVVLLVVITQILQGVGLKVADSSDRRKR
ncbi:MULTISPECIES: methionine ABC transporter permease [Caproicibacterium]|jgi:D-methionine transport system permease protein|uniref:Methionine ABC transporter permease MetI n=1 Tax=Caproicibacterium lactatifermentans TaxID=2666138 RepID=A0A859DPN9_9FIRM|nr:methionine ABC transporter permease [Caproicibacterium lactatifermentans]ARP50857.1 methionine ABC transporter permease [Ruminococcaceae bacterium CPB6]MDD4808074.1 ABC transporter permease [Oscillospiraceae bacterium]QKN23415.1 methionine ABC transporter permease MetI [Caproicibacterium lactatifermentans]QKO29907.1 methionine ABC transporter permease MetI [Caproicibacterium lactatifermentans]